MKERQSVTKELSKRYKRSTKKVKGRMLDEFTILTGYNRSYAGYILKKQPKAIRGKKRRSRSRKYGAKEVKALTSIWKIMDCGKRLTPILKEIIPILEKSCVWNK